MKQKLTALLLVLLLAVTLVLPVMAAETYVDDEPRSSRSRRSKRSRRAPPRSRSTTASACTSA